MPSSRNPIGTHVKVGGAFAELFAHPATAGVPVVLETPGSRKVGDPGTALLRRLRDDAAAPALRAAG